MNGVTITPSEMTRSFELSRTVVKRNQISGSTNLGPHLSKTKWSVTQFFIKLIVYFPTNNIESATHEQFCFYKI